MALNTRMLSFILCFEMAQNTRLQQRAHAPLVLLGFYLSNICFVALVKNS